MWPFTVFFFYQLLLPACQEISAPAFRHCCSSRVLFSANKREPTLRFLLTVAWACTMLHTKLKVFTRNAFFFIKLLNLLNGISKQESGHIWSAFTLGYSVLWVEIISAATSLNEYLVCLCLRVGGWSCGRFPVEAQVCWIQKRNQEVKHQECRVLWTLNRSLFVQKKKKTEKNVLIFFPAPTLSQNEVCR